jgi:hypothetical protein
MAVGAREDLEWWVRFTVEWTDVTESVKHTVYRFREQIPETATPTATDLDSRPDVSPTRSQQPYPLLILIWVILLPASLVLLVLPPTPTFNLSLP